MTHWTDDKEDVPAAVHHRLLRISKSQETTFDTVAVRYATERLLYRLSQSEHRRRFVLKGAWLFHLWEIPRRTTRDVDFLGHGENSVEHIADVIRDVSRIEVTPDDGLVFDPTSIDAQELHEPDEYSGVRVRITAHLGPARIRAQVDVAFGAALVEPPVEADLPVLLDFPQPRLRAYNAEASIAEKLEAMVRFGVRNSRMKDYFDLFVLSEERGFHGPLLAKQISATFSRRETTLFSELPPGLTDRFGEERERDWRAFLASSDGVGVPEEFPHVVARVRGFAYPALRAAAEGESLHAQWVPGRGWVDL